MKFKKNTIILMDDKKIIAREANKKFLRRVTKNLKKDLNISNKIDLLNESEISIKNRNLYIIIEGEKILVKFLTIPKVKKSLIQSTVINELKYNFIDVSSIIFSYSLVKIHDDKLELIVFCIDSNKINNLKGYLKNGNELQRVNLIQFCFLKHFEERIKSDNSCCVFKFNEYYYFLLCSEKQIIANNVIKKNIETDEENEFELLTDNIKDFLENNSEYSKDTQCIYFSNIKSQKEFPNKFFNVDTVDLGYISDEEIIDSMELKR